MMTAYAIAFGCLLLLGGRVADVSVGGGVPHRPARLCDRLRRRRYRAELRRPRLRASDAGRVRGAPHADRALAGRSQLHRAARTGDGLRDLRHHRRNRRRRRPGRGWRTVQYLTWRWCLYVNVPIAVIAAVGGNAFLPDPPRSTQATQFDIPGAALATGALVALVYGCTQAVTSGWSGSGVVALLLAGAVLIVAFVIRELVTSAPLLPLRIVLDRNRVGEFMPHRMLLRSAGCSAPFFSSRTTCRWCSDIRPSRPALRSCRSRSRRNSDPG